MAKQIYENRLHASFNQEPRAKSQTKKVCVCDLDLRGLQPLIRYAGKTEYTEDLDCKIESIRLAVPLKLSELDNKFFAGLCRRYGKHSELAFQYLENLDRLLALEQRIS